MGSAGIEEKPKKDAERLDNDGTHDIGKGAERAITSLYQGNSTGKNGKRMRVEGSGPYLEPPFD